MTVTSIIELLTADARSFGSVVRCELESRMTALLEKSEFTRLSCHGPVLLPAVIAPLLADMHQVC